MKTLKYFLIAAFSVAVAVVFLIFSFQNDTRVALCFDKFCTREGYLSVFVLISFFVGMVFSGLFFAIPLIRMKSFKAGLRKQIKKYEQELHIIRNQPLEDLPLNRSVEVAKLVDEERASPHLLQTP